MPKFVKYVPTPPQLIDTFFELAPVTADDVVYDLGSGDGRLLFTALERGAGRCVGIDIDPHCVYIAREEAKNKGLDQQVTFIEGDVLDQDLSEATVIFVYLIQSGIAFLRPKFETELRPGTRIVVETYSVQGLKPVKVKEAGKRFFYLYVTPFERTPDYDPEPSNTATEYDWWYFP
ncbi:MAG: class I SAM-dependent methyltransferase [Dehalococcoidales bacterium]|nr:MAG: class I SAM-dependent methyltransferase [Dehalococcoidales bacterium]